MCCYLDETGEALAAILRPGNAGSNTAADHFTVLGLALEQLPPEDLDREILVRTDIGGATHAFTADCREARIRFSVGYELTESVRAAILKASQAAWVQAIDADREDRDGAWVAELTGHLDLSGWVEGTRLICRRERPHPGAQFEIFGEHGYRYTCFLTDQDGEDIAELELRHRGRARVEDSIRTGKDTGMRNLPHHAFAHNQTWLELSLIAQDLLTCHQADLPDRSARDRRTQAPAPAAFARRRQARAPRTTHPPQARSRLALGPRARRRIPAPAHDPGALLSTRPIRGHHPDDQPAAPTISACPQTDPPPAPARQCSTTQPAIAAPTTALLQPSPLAAESRSPPQR